MPEFVIGICRGQFQLQDQAVYFVDAHSHCQSFLHCVLDQPLCVQHHLRGTMSTNTLAKALHKMLSRAWQAVTLTGRVAACRKAWAQPSAMSWSSWDLEVGANPTKFLESCPLDISDINNLFHFRYYGDRDANNLGNQPTGHMCHAQPGNRSWRLDSLIWLKNISFSNCPSETLQYQKQNPFRAFTIKQDQGLHCKSLKWTSGRTWHSPPQLHQWKAQHHLRYEGLLSPHRKNWHDLQKKKQRWEWE